MYLTIAIVLFTTVIIGLSMLNVQKIKELERKNTELTKNLANQLSRLNERLSSVVSTNNQINMKNMKSLLDKLDRVEDASTRSDDRIKNDIDNIRRKLTYLMENDEIYSLIMKDAEGKSKKDDDKVQNSN